MEASLNQMSRKKRKALPHSIRPDFLETPDVEDFPEQLETFAKEVIAFLDRLNDFSEFRDEEVNSAISAFVTDFSYWASCLKTYKGIDCIFTLIILSKCVQVNSKPQLCNNIYMTSCLRWRITWTHLLRCCRSSLKLVCFRCINLYQYQFTSSC